MQDLDPGDRDVAMVFQNHALYPHMTVRENLEFGLKIRRLPQAEMDSRVGDAIEWLELGSCLDRFPSQLSGGQCQRVALGRAVARRPGVLLLDEPLSNLDLPLRVRMRADLLRLHARLRTTILHVTHDQTEAMCLGNRIAILGEGSLMQIGSPTEVYRNPASQFVAGFVGSPPMNLFLGSVRGTSPGPELLFMEQVGAGRKAFQFSLPPSFTTTLYGYQNRPVIAGFRPEFLKIVSSNHTETAISASVEFVECPGPEYWIHFRTHGHDGIIRTWQKPPTFKPGQPVQIEMESEQVCFFDGISGKAIGH